MASGSSGSEEVILAKSPAELPSLETSPWQWWRAQMPVTAKWAYLDHAAIGPLSGPAAEAISDFAQQAACEGDTVWPSWVAKAEQLRRDIAAMTGSHSHEICLVPNTTTGVNLVAEGWPWQPGDNVVLPAGEFPSNLFPWQNQRSRGVEVRVVPRRDGGQVLVEDLMSHVDSDTRIIAASWVGYASGFRIDIETLVQQAHQQGVLVFLDAIQGLGMYPLDVQKVPVDFLAADGHKWLLGPEGAGVAMIRREHLDRLRVGNVGWGSVKGSFNYADPQFNLKDTAARFESGSANLMGFAALAASTGMMRQICQQHGDHAIADRVRDLARMLHLELQELGIVSRLAAEPEHQSSIVTFEIPGVEPGDVRKRAANNGVVVSCRDGGIRASIHAYNNEQDLQQLIDVVRVSM